MAFNNDSTVFSTEKKKGGAYVLTSAAVTALSALTTSSTISDALDILSTVVKNSHVVTSTSIGFASSAPAPAGVILTLDAASLVAGSGYADGSYTDVALTGGDGTGATADITVSGGEVTAVTLVEGGTDYSVGNTLSADDADLGGDGGSGFAIDVATV